MWQESDNLSTGSALNISIDTEIEDIDNLDRLFKQTLGSNHSDSCDSSKTPTTFSPESVKSIRDQQVYMSSLSPFFNSGSSNAHSVWEPLEGKSESQLLNTIALSSTKTTEEWTPSTTGTTGRGMIESPIMSLNHILSSYSIDELHFSPKSNRDVQGFYPLDNEQYSSNYYTIDDPLSSLNKISNQNITSSNNAFMSQIGSLATNIETNFNYSSPLKHERSLSFSPQNYIGASGLDSNQRKVEMRSVSPRQQLCLKLATEYASSRPYYSSRSSRDISKAKADEACDGFIYLVRFKRAHRSFVLSSSAPRCIQPGMFVKVEADRGEDLGILLAKIPVHCYEEEIPTAGYRGRGFSSGTGDRKFIIRLATSQEKAQLHDKVRDEEKVLQAIREKVQQRKLPMSVLDAEFQFDRHKLTYFFEADRRIDFRELVSELFSLYKTRIWMQQVDTSTVQSNDDPEMKLAFASGILPTSDEIQNIHSSFQFNKISELSIDSSGSELLQVTPFSAFGMAESATSRFPSNFGSNNLNCSFDEQWFSPKK